MAEEDIQDPATPDDPEVDTEAASLAVDDGKGNKMVPLSALIGSKRQMKALSKRVAELEPIATRAQEIDARLLKVQPFIEAITSNPKLQAEVLRLSNGTRPSADTTAQPTDDADASQHAEDMGWYLPDGMTLDIARGRRVLDRLDARHVRQIDDRIRPLAGVTLGQKAEANLREAMSQTDNHGVPLATAESIREVAAQLPPNLLADPKVVDLVLNSAIGIDRRNNRTPKAPEEPLFMEHSGGHRRAEPTLTTDEREFIARHGIKEADYIDSSKRLADGVANRRGIVLGKS